jgi:hypothetical protein
MSIKRIGGKAVPKGYPLTTLRTKFEAEREKRLHSGKIKIKKSKAGYTLYRYD